MVRHTSHIKDVLAKLEDPTFIHMYVPYIHNSDQSSEKRFIYELPRYGLQFERQGQVLVSLDYSGYYLSKEQQLVTWHDVRDSDSKGLSDYTLSNFQQYLLLQRIPNEGVMVGPQRSDTLALVAVGQVACERNPDEPLVVTVQVNDSSDAVLKVSFKIAGNGFGNGRWKRKGKRERKRKWKRKHEPEPETESRAGSELETDTVLPRLFPAFCFQRLL